MTDNTFEFRPPENAIYGYYMTPPGIYYLAVMPRSEEVYEVFDSMGLSIYKTCSNPNVFYRCSTREQAEEYVKRFGGFVEEYEIKGGSISWGEKF